VGGLLNFTGTVRAACSPWHDRGNLFLAGDQRTDPQQPSRCGEVEKGGRLSLSDKTVRNQISRGFDKLGVW